MWKWSQEHSYFKIVDKSYDRFPTVYKMSQESFHKIIESKI